MSACSVYPIRPEKDAADIARLVESCFRPWLDRENLDYLKSLLDEGLYAQRHPLLTKFSSFPYKLEGVVCRDESGELLGLINTYDFSLNDRPCALLANICVKASRRKEGIASRMLDEIELIRKDLGTQGLFLQARLEKPEVIGFYRKRGFRVTDYRENWILPANRKKPDASDCGFRLEKVPCSDIASFDMLMQKAYPPSVLWNLDCSRDLFRAGSVAEIRNRLNDPDNRFRRVTDQDGRVRLWAAYQKRKAFADSLWLIPAGDLTPGEYKTVLKVLAAEFIRKKPVKIDTAVGWDPVIFRSAGFQHMQTLAWMWKKL